MRLLIPLIGFGIIISVSSKTLQVSDSKGLLGALKSVTPGDIIIMSNGVYSGEFVATISGSKNQPITLKGSRQAVLRSGNYGFWLKANYWLLQGFTVQGSKKGIVVEGGSFNTLDSLEVKNIQQEGIHFRYNSNNNVLKKSFIHHTGQGSEIDQGYGEGVYIGQAVSNWKNRKPDKSDGNQILNNQIGPRVAAEAIDIKEGTCCGIIKGNTFVGPQSGIHYADSWVDLKGDKYTIEENIGNNPTKNGFEIHHVDAAGMGGCNNVIRNNHCNGIPPGGKCVIDLSKCSNTIENNR